jgi:hypothetical protein
VATTAKRVLKKDKMNSEISSLKSVRFCDLVNPFLGAPRNQTTGATNSRSKHYQKCNLT